MTNKDFIKIDEIIRQYNEVLFRMAVTDLIDRGSRHYTDKTVKAIKKNCIKEEAEIKADGGIPIMTAAFQIKIVECAQELSKIPTWELLRYIKKKIFIGQGGN